jgi:hypothetical protein
MAGAGQHFAEANSDGRPSNVAHAVCAARAVHVMLCVLCVLCMLCMSCRAGVVMAKLGAVVTVTDLASNLPLLQHNCKTNGAYTCVGCPLAECHCRGCRVGQLASGVICAGTGVC